jgi:hypothetical protein
LELVYQPNSVLLEFASNFTAFGQTPNQLAVAKQLDKVAFDPREAQLLSFLQNEPIGNLAADFDKISPDSLSALYEISYSAANVQASNLENRFAEIRNGSTGFASSLNISNSPGAMVESRHSRRNACLRFGRFLFPAAFSEIQQLLRDINHVASRAINRGSRLALQDWP